MSSIKPPNSRIPVLDVFVDNLNTDEFLSRAVELAGSDSFNLVVTPNAEIVYAAQQDEELRRIISSAALVTPDGAGIILAGKINGTPFKEKVAGVVLGRRILPLLAEKGYGVYLLGARPGIADTAAANLKKECPDITFSGIHDGYFTDDDAIIEEINASGAKVLYCCLGAPKAEKWLYSNRDKLKVSLALPLGGSLDIYAGAAKRAPSWMIKLGLEWLYRLCREPKRIGRMMNLPRFLFKVIGRKLSGKKN